MSKKYHTRESALIKAKAYYNIIDELSKQATTEQVVDFMYWDAAIRDAFQESDNFSEEFVTIPIKKSSLTIMLYLLECLQLKDKSTVYEDKLEPDFLFISIRIKNNITDDKK